MTTETTSVLIVDDERLFAKAVAKKLGRGGFECTLAATKAEAEQVLRHTRVQLLLLDMRLPDGSGLDLLRQLSRAGDVPPTVVMTAYGEVEDAVAAMKYGAIDYLTKPVDLDRLQQVLEQVWQRGARPAQHEQGAATTEPPEIVGDSALMHQLRSQLERIVGLAGTGGPPPTVLLQGETGVGKDQVARWLHAHSVRTARPFVHVDCAALPGELIEAELFGHARGAFTGAHGERAGLIEAAGDGTVFLDEVGELPPALQAKLLAVLERRRLRRVGSSREQAVAAWFIAASNRDLAAMAEAGAFRTDLLYRLKVLSLSVPPLRERDADVILLAQHFAAVTAQHYRLPAADLDDSARALLQRYGWPGNVRELKNVIERALLLGGDGSAISAAALQLEPTPSGSAESEPALSLEQAEIDLIERALATSGGNVSAASRQLGITRMTLRYRMQKYGIGKVRHPT